MPERSQMLVSLEIGGADCPNMIEINDSLAILKFVSQS